MTSTPRTNPRTASRHPLTIAVFLDMNTGAWRDVFLGIADYANEQGPWVLMQTDLRHIGKKDHLPSPPQGCIAALGDPWSLEQIKTLHVPVVNVSGNTPVSKYPSVLPDNTALGAMAAGYFLERGFRHLACIPHAGRFSSDERMKGFEDRILQSGHPPPLNYNNDLGQARRSPARAKSHLEHWLCTLPKPCGLFAFNDATAKSILETCRELRIDVPTDLAVLGVDNDTLICETTFPPLSSVNPNFRKVGQVAAATLHSMILRKGRVSAEPTRIQPTGVHSRHSTDILAVEDPIVAKSLRYIREQTGNPIAVTDVVKHASVSRRMLERRFSEALGHTLHEEIQRSRIDRAKDLLSAGGHTVEEICEASGFTYAAHFTQVFRRSTGMTPSAYRKEMAQSRLPPPREI